MQEKLLKMTNDQRQKRQIQVRPTTASSAECLEVSSPTAREEVSETQASCHRHCKMESHRAL